MVIILPMKNNVFNVVEQIINTTSERTIKLNTRRLTDAEQEWLSGLLTSKQIYLQADTDLWIPVTLTDSSYSTRSTGTMSEPNIKQFTFRFAEGFDMDGGLKKLPF
ncbi:hypothetical protein MKQ70_16590 [Chitinophaga sedimenti]|uniref:hypothetical protein n=1 Tax=Chitinophaga sedimenti TaxID=2033606 RepID=UPI002004024E|nr:hypothetical protein [Chitinophaga sedimenti]MCK7556547.1 hypothetical protein [Chitinophaga sedimenti]